MRSAFPFRHCAPRAFLTCHQHGESRGRGPGSQFWGGPVEEMDDEPFGGGFGVRRPLRFLAHKLDLDDRQIGEMARILDELKTERAQAEVDRRRTLSAFADAVSGDTFDAAKAGEGGELRTKSAERVRDAVVKALRQIHGLLTLQRTLSLWWLTGTHVARKETQGMKLAATFFDMRLARLLIAALGVRQNVGGSFEMLLPVIPAQRQSDDHGVGGVPDLADGDGRIFPPATAGSGGLRTNG
jgi:hypothetical protein